MRTIRPACIPVCILIALSGSAAAQTARSYRVNTDASGTYLLRADTPANRPRPFGGIDTTLWSYLDPVAIPETCALSPISNSAWVGQQLNSERLQRFDISGNGIPAFEVPGHHATFNPAAVAAAANADLAVFLDQIALNSVLILTAYRSGSATPAWTYNLDENWTLSDIHNVKVSRDGSTVAVLVADNPQGNPPPPQNTACIFLNGADGSVRSVWMGTNGGCSGVDLTDNGGTAIVCQGAPPAGFGRLINTANGSVIQSFNGNGAGGRYNISGDGRVLVIGGFDFRVFVKVNGVYSLRINFNAPTSWFSWASAVSRDGSTVGALAHDYASGYLNTTTRIWDVATAQLLGSYPTIGSGQYQDSAWGAAMSDNGSRLAVCTWGDQVNTHPEVMVFDRSVHLIDSIDTSGSPFSLDMSGDGQYVLAGNKSVHANIFGNGGLVTLLQIPIATTCYPNCDSSTTSPILNVLDFTCFLNQFAAGATYANCDASTTPPTLNVNDFLCFLNRFAAGCP